jgi:hypothetical protein
MTRCSVTALGPQHTSTASSWAWAWSKEEGLRRAVAHQCSGSVAALRRWGGGSDGLGSKSTTRGFFETCMWEGRGGEELFPWSGGGKIEQWCGGDLPVWTKGR